MGVFDIDGTVNKWRSQSGSLKTPAIRQYMYGGLEQEMIFHRKAPVAPSCVHNKGPAASSKATFAFWISQPKVW